MTDVVRSKRGEATSGRFETPAKLLSERCVFICINWMPGGQLYHDFRPIVYGGNQQSSGEVIKPLSLIQGLGCAFRWVPYRDSFTQKANFSTKKAN